MAKNKTSETSKSVTAFIKSSLYSNFVAIKEKILPDDFVQKWMRIFKASELVYN